MVFNDKGSHYKFMKHDIKLFFGDLNFRINLSYDAVVSNIESMTHDNYDEQLHILLNNDQLNQYKMDYEWIMWFKEMPIKFLPTYKYDKHSNEYDTSKKQRIPSWTDRILWHNNDRETNGKDSRFIQPLFYERRESIFSDHRPVCAYFELRWHKHNTERKLSFKNKVAKKEVSSNIVKKPYYNPEESKVK